MSTVSENSKQDLAEELIIRKMEFDKGSTFLSYTYYLFLIVFITLILISFSLYTYDPGNGFIFAYYGFWFFIADLGIQNYDNVFRIVMILLNVSIGLGIILYNLIFTIPIVLVYYPVMIFALYTLIFDKRANTLFRYKFNKKLSKLNLLILVQYIYLMIDGLLNISFLNNNENENPEIVLVYYIFLLFFFANLVLVQKLFYNGRILMFFSSSVFIIYSIYAIYSFSQYFKILAIIINIAMILFLLLDKETISQFKKGNSENYYFYKIIVGLNIFAIICGILAVLYIYSETLNVSYLAGGFVFIIFYAICIFKIIRYSIIWKHITSALMLILFISSVIFFFVSATFSILFLPVSFITFFGFNVDSETKSYFKKMKANDEYIENIVI